MHRILTILLICLFPLQSFAGLAMSTKMDVLMNAPSQMQMADAAQAPCHMALEADLAASQDCCGSPVECKTICHAMCHIFSVVPMQAVFVGAVQTQTTQRPFVAVFQSADLRAGFKPPIL